MLLLFSPCMYTLFQFQGFSLQNMHVYELQLNTFCSHSSSSSGNYNNIIIIANRITIATNKQTYNFVTGQVLFKASQDSFAKFYTNSFTTRVPSASLSSIHHCHSFISILYSASCHCSQLRGGLGYCPEKAVFSS